MLSHSGHDVKTTTPMLKGCDHHTMWVNNGLIFVADTFHFEGLEVDCYDPTTKQWSNIIVGEKIMKYKEVEKNRFAEAVPNGDWLYFINGSDKMCGDDDENFSYQSTLHLMDPGEPGQA